MRFRNGNIDDLLEQSKGKKLVVYGVNNLLTRLCGEFNSYNLFESISFITDIVARGETFEFNGKQVSQVKFDTFLTAHSGGEFVVLFTRVSDLINFEACYYAVPADTLFYCGEFLLHSPPSYQLPPPEVSAKQKIPKTLHYVWLGGNPLPPAYRKYIEGWKMLCPDYEIICWDESNYDVNKHPFMKEAYSAKNWTFAADYARIDILYTHGGIYLDTDVELLKPLDRFLYDEGFCGMANAGWAQFGSPFGAVAGHEFIRKCLDIYDGISFVNKDGSFNQTTQSNHASGILRQNGLVSENRIQKAFGFTVYPTDVFVPVTIDLIVECLTENTHACHHFALSWGSKEAARNRHSIAKIYRDLVSKYSKEEVYRFPLPDVPGLKYGE